LDSAQRAEKVFAAVLRDFVGGQLAILVGIQPLEDGLCFATDVHGRPAGGGA
jgi:hypothetical protein